MKKIILMFFAGVLVFSLWAVPAQAFVIKTGQDVTVAKGEAINETLLVSGQNITIDADVNGDVICAGQTIMINGSVNGDVICAGQMITVANSVAGSVRAVGQNVQINGNVGRNVTVAGQTVSEKSMIAGEMLFAGQSALINGEVAKSAAGAANSITVNGKINGNAEFNNKNLILGKTAVINGALVYTSANEASRDSGAQLAGGVTRNQPAPINVAANQKKEKPIEEKIGDKIVGLVMNLAIALLLVFFLRKPVLKIINAMLTKTGRAFGWGILLIVTLPIVMIMILMTIIGIPIALLLGLLYALALFLSRILAAIAIGRMITQMYWKSKQESLLAAAVIGVILSWIIFAIPAAGTIFSIAFAIWGFGGIYYLFKKTA